MLADIFLVRNLSLHYQDHWLWVIRKAISGQYSSLMLIFIITVFHINKFLSSNTNANITAAVSQL